MGKAMKSAAKSTIPNRAETLKVLRLMGQHAPILMLTGDPDGYGTRWILHGQQIQPVIARFLLKSGFIADSGATEFGARTLNLTPRGSKFREDGVAWWASLTFFQKLWITVLG